MARIPALPMLNEMWSGSGASDNPPPVRRKLPEPFAHLRCDHLRGDQRSADVNCQMLWHNLFRVQTQC
jgi:hypothetical protein